MEVNSVETTVYSHLGAKENLKTIYGEVVEPENEENKKVILAIHGNPGSHKNYRRLAQSVNYSVFRMLAPDLPGLGWTPQIPYFQQTTQMRADFVVNFLHSLKIDNSHIIIAHSAGSHLALRLVRDQPEICKSLIFVSPMTLRPHRATRPFWLIKFLGYLWTFTLLKPVIRTFYQAVAYLIPRFTSLRIDHSAEHSVADVIISMVDVAANWNFEESRIDTKMLKNNTKLPVFVLYGNKDHFVERKLTEEFSEVLGVDKQSHLYCSTKEEETEVLEKIKKLQNEGMNKFAVCFDNQGHFVHATKTQFVINLCKNMLKCE